jgi:hypothetical protein
MKNLTCPKCGGSDYFVSQRNVMKGIGGIWGNRGGIRGFPVCRVCDEIMTSRQIPEIQQARFDKTDKIQFGLVGVLILASLIPISPIMYLSITLLYANVITWIVRRVIKSRRNRGIF